MLRSAQAYSGMRPLTKISVLIAWAAVAATATADPQYQIFDIGVVQVGDTASQGFGVSPAGVAVGRSFRSGGAQAFSWTQGGGLVGLPNLAGRSFAVSNDANDSGVVVGTAATTAFGSGRLPVIWQSGAVSQLPLPAGETLGDANGVNALGVAVGSVDGGSTQQAVIYNGGSATVITQTTPNGSFFVTAFGINNSGRIVGPGHRPEQRGQECGDRLRHGKPRGFRSGRAARRQRSARFRRGQRRPRRGLEHDEPGLGHAVHLVGGEWNRGDTAGHRHEPGLGPGVNSAGLGGGPGFLGLLDSVPLGWDDDLSAGGPSASRLGLGLVDEHFVVGARHQ